MMDEVSIMETKRVRLVNCQDIFEMQDRLNKREEARKKRLQKKFDSTKTRLFKDIARSIHGACKKNELKGWCYRGDLSMKLGEIALELDPSNFSKIMDALVFEIRDLFAQDNAAELFRVGLQTQPRLIGPGILYPHINCLL